MVVNEKNKIVSLTTRGTIFTNEALCEVTNGDCWNQNKNNELTINQLAIKQQNYVHAFL